MDIFAQNGKFMVGLMTVHGFESKWNKDNTLSLWSDKKKSLVTVSTHQGDFIEITDDAGEVLGQGGDGQWFSVPLTREPIRLRFKKLPRPALSKAEMNKHRQTRTRYLVCDQPYSLKIPDTLPGAIKWMEEQLKKIPAGSRAKARFEFDTTTEYGETYPQIEITYSEPETDKEVIVRLQIDAERARLAEQAERTKLENLKKKYEAA